jgi:hypothetical protein
MKFITPCFVSVEDAEKRKRLLEDLSGIGYSLTYGAQVSHIGGRPIIMCDEGSVFTYREETREMINEDDFIDCGTDIGLFKALAAMNEDKVAHQWFIANANLLFKKLRGAVETADGKKYVPTGGWFKPIIPELDFKFMGCGRGAVIRKATAAEIVEYFKSLELKKATEDVVNCMLDGDTSGIVPDLSNIHELF